MKAVDLSYHFRCNPYVFIVLSSVWLLSYCCLLWQTSIVSPSFVTLFDSHQYQQEQRLCHYRQRVVLRNTVFSYAGIQLLHQVLILSRQTEHH